MQPPCSTHKHIQVVSTFSDLIDLQLQGDTNAVCWSRQFQGNFQEIVYKLDLIDNITEVTVEDLQALELSEQGELARAIILKDIELLTECGASPSLNLLKNYERDDELDFISTDVYSYHVDRSPIATDTFLCTYYGAASDILPNEQARQKVLIPEIRAKLKELFDGPESEFEDFLTECFFDLHYQACEDAIPINLGVGHLWRLAVDHPTQEVLPCVHRAPSEAGEYRLLLIC